MQETAAKLKNATSGICMAWIEKSGICMAWIDQNDQKNNMQRPTVSLDLENLE